MENTIKVLAKDLTAVQISDVNTIFSNDSICIFQLKCSGNNMFGGVVSKEIEYAYLSFKNINGEIVTWEAVVDLDKDVSLLKIAHDAYSERIYDDIAAINDKSEKEKKAFYIASTITFYKNARVVNNNDNESPELDVDNW